MNFDRLKSERNFVVYNRRIAELLIFKFGLKELIRTEPSRRDCGKTVYRFYSGNEIIDYFKMLVEGSRSEQESAVKPTKTIETVKVNKEVKEKAVEIVTVIEDEEKYPKPKRGRKKKVEAVKE